MFYYYIYNDSTDHHSVCACRVVSSFILEQKSGGEEGGKLFYSIHSCWRSLTVFFLFCFVLFCLLLFFVFFLFVCFMLSSAECAGG